MGVLEPFEAVYDGRDLGSHAVRCADGWGNGGHAEGAIADRSALLKERKREFSGGVAAETLLDWDELEVKWWCRRLCRRLRR